VTKVVVSYAVDSSNVFVNYKGQNVDTTKDWIVTYNGKDYAADLSYQVKSKSGDELKQGTDYEVVITTEVDGKTQEVTEIIDAGTYTITIKGKSYDMDVAFDVVVNPATISTLEPTNYDFDEDFYVTDKGSTVAAGEYIFAYTGDVIAAEYSLGKGVNLTADDYDIYYVQVADSKGKAVKSASGLNYTYSTTTTSGNDTITTTSSYNEKQFSAEDTAELKEEGVYKVVIKLKDSVTNYKLSSDLEALYVKVSSEKVFLDVPNDAWYTQYVYNAEKAGYVKGYNNGKFFGPDDNIKRGDAVLILARMAGIDNLDQENSTSANFGYTNPFADVDNGTYYAEAIAWASNVGIVTGTSATTFEPERNITREEFATILQRYANLCENGAAVAENTATELAKYTDGTAVCDWAKDAVAWASSQKIMTGYAGTTVLDPEAPVTRAQVAKMVITYQPDGANSIYANSRNDAQTRN
jgi:molybdopterin converting factor small subunit